LYPICTSLEIDILTIILTLACPAYVIQVSDRLVSKRLRGALTPYDARANKSLLYQARNALVAIGYASTAYISGVPTDQWIARLLWGKPFPLGPDGLRIPKVLGRNPYVPHIDYAVWTIKSALEPIPAALSGLYITVAGWRMRRRYLKPFVLELENPQGSSVLKIGRGDRYWVEGQNVRLHGIGVELSAEQQRRLASRLREQGAYRGDWRAARQVLSETVLELAGTPIGVGANAMSIALPHPKIGIPEVAFLPTEDHDAPLITGRGITIDVEPVFFTPWLIGPMVLYPPSAEVGDTRINLGGTEVHVEGAPSTKGLLALSTSVRRPPPP
jgi:hypothetical protein